MGPVALPDGVLGVRFPLNGGIVWMNMVILLPDAEASFACGLAEDVLTIADALDEGAG